MDIKVRKMGNLFNFEELESAQVRKGYPEESYFLIGASVLLPGLEPFLMRTMKAATSEVKDPELREAMAAFSAQEGQHYQQHQRLNTVILERGFPGLAKYEKAVQATYQRMSKQKSLKFNVAYSACFEAMTTAAASVTFETNILAEHAYEPSVRQLFEWHLGEEVEHRCVAWDVYEDLYGGYWYRNAMMVYMVSHILYWVGSIVIWMLRNDPDYPKNYDISLIKRLRDLGESELSGLKHAVKPFIPGYSPHKVEIPEAEKITGMLKEYEDLAAKA